MAYRLLHFSDLHLDASFAADGVPSAVGDWRRADLRAALSRILALAREQRVDAVTIAGDLYDERTALPDTGEFLAQQFERLGQIKVLIAPGRSDRYTAHSLYALTRWPSNVRIFSANRLTSVEMAPGIQLWGAGQAGPAPIAEMPPSQDGMRLLLRHEGDRRGESLDSDALRRAGFALALSGGPHTGGEWLEDAPICAWGGSPEPLSSDDADGERGVLLVTLEEGQARWQRAPVARWRYWRTRVDISGCADREGVLGAIKAVLASAPGGADERLICSITVEHVPALNLDYGSLTADLETPAHVSVKPRLAATVDLERVADEQTVRGLLARRMQARLASIQDGQARQLALKALALALDALEGRQVRDHETA